MLLSLINLKNFKWHPRSLETSFLLFGPAFWLNLNLCLNRNCLLFVLSKSVLSFTHLLYEIQFVIESLFNTLPESWKRRGFVALGRDCLGTGPPPPLSLTGLDQTGENLREVLWEWENKEIYDRISLLIWTWRKVGGKCFPR